MGKPDNGKSAVLDSERRWMYFPPSFGGCRVEVVSGAAKLRVVCDDGSEPFFMTARGGWSLTKIKPSP